MPQALRDFALEQLADSDLELQVRRQHAQHVADIAHASRLWKWGATPDQLAAFTAIVPRSAPLLDGLASTISSCTHVYARH